MQYGLHTDSIVPQALPGGAHRLHSRTFTGPALLLLESRNFTRPTQLPK